MKQVSYFILIRVLGEYRCKPYSSVTFIFCTLIRIFNRQGACNRLQSSELVQELRTVILDAAEKTRAAYDVLSSSNRTRTTQYHTLSHRANLQKPNTGCFGLRGPDTRVPDRAFRTELAPQPYDAAGRARGAASRAWRRTAPHHTGCCDGMLHR